MFFACTKCRTVYSDLDTLRSHDCHPPAPADPPPITQPNNNSDKKRKRGPPATQIPTPKPAVVQEKVRLNECGAVYVPPQKRYDKPVHARER